MSRADKNENQIFICYRRNDSAWVAGRLYDRLVQCFGKEAIFKDVDSIPPGLNFKHHIDSVIKQCAVVLVLIGDRWLGEPAETGKRHIDDSRDFVRIEIESALQRNIPVIPLLIQNASIPADEILPPTMKELAYRHGVPIGNDPHFHTDVDRLIKSIEAHFASKLLAADEQLTINAAEQDTAAATIDLIEPPKVRQAHEDVGTTPSVAGPTQADSAQEPEPITTVQVPKPLPEPVAAADSASSSFDRPPRKSSPRLWIVGGITVLVLGIALTLWVLTRSELSVEEAQNIGIAATVNGKHIMLSDIDRVISNQSQGESAKLSSLELKQTRLRVLDNLIQREALFQRAERAALLPSEDEVTQLINTQKQQASMTEEAFQQQLQAQKQTEASLREEARKELAIQRLQAKAHGKITVSDKELADFFEHNRAQYIDKRGVGLAVIVADPNDNGATNDAKGDTEAKNKIDIIYQRLKSGADFATVAREQSEDRDSVIRGGDLGFFDAEALKKAGFPPDLVARLFNLMQIGESTEPIKTEDGRWYIFKLTDRRLQNVNLMLDSPGVRDQIRETLINKQKEALNDELLKAAMSEAKVVNFLASHSQQS